MVTMQKGVYIQRVSQHYDMHGRLVAKFKRGLSYMVVRSIATIEAWVLNGNTAYFVFLVHVGR